MIKLETAKKILVVFAMIFLIAYNTKNVLPDSIKSYCIIFSYVFGITALIISIIQRKNKPKKT